MNKKELNKTAWQQPTVLSVGRLFHLLSVKTSAKQKAQSVNC
jgi:hypothetical protein